MTRAVTVYSSPLCAPCERLKRMLVERGVTFEVRDVMMDEAAAETLERRRIRTTPVLQVDDVFLAGEDLRAERIDELLGGA